MEMLQLSAGENIGDMIFVQRTKGVIGVMRHTVDVGPTLLMHNTSKLSIAVTSPKDPLESANRSAAQQTRGGC